MRTFHYPLLHKHRHVRKKGGKELGGGEGERERGGIKGKEKDVKKKFGFST